ncbi:MAG: hypothetical protein ACRDV0_03835 [Acidimicrobiales bacterium]
MARRLLASTLLGLSSIALLFAALVAGLAPLLHSPAATADAVVAVASSPAVRDSVAVKIVGEVRRELTGPAATAVGTHGASLERAIESAIDDPTVQRLARDDLTRALTAAKSRGASTIDLRPLLRRFTAVMHSVDHAIPAHPALSRDAAVRVHGLGALTTGSGVWGAAQLVLTALGALGVVLTSRLLVRNESARLSAVAVGFGAPAVLVLVTGLGLPRVIDRGVDRNDPASATIVHAAAARVGSSFTTAGLAYLALAAVATGLWWLGGHWRRRGHAREGA